MTCIKAWMSLNLGQMPLLTMELAALERLKNRRHHFFSVAIDPPPTTELAALEKIPIDL